MDALPSELLLRIFVWLPVHDLCSVARVCRRWNDVGSDDALWRHKCIRAYQGTFVVGGPQVHPYAGWKDAYRRCRWAYFAGVKLKAWAGSSAMREEMRREFGVDPPMTRTTYGATYVRRIIVELGNSFDRATSLEVLREIANPRREESDRPAVPEATQRRIERRAQRAQSRAQQRRMRM